MGRMLCIADAFDAMISQRSYKQAIPVSQALQILRQESGRQFDPALVPIFVRLVESGAIEIPSEGSPLPPPERPGDDPA